MLIEGEGRHPRAEENKLRGYLSFALGTQFLLTATIAICLNNARTSGPVDTI